MALTKRAKKFAGMLSFLVVVGGVSYEAYTHQDLLKGSKTNTGVDLSQNQTPQEQVAQAETPTQAPAPVSTQPYVQNADTLKSILANCVVRVSVENPSEPFYNDDSGNISGFNVDFAHLLFADQAFTSQTRGCQIRVDMNHEVPEYAQVPKQLLATDSNGQHTVDIAMDGLTYQDDQPVEGIEYSAPYVTDFGYSLIVGPSSKIKTQSQLNDPDTRIGILKGDPDVKAFVHRLFPLAAVQVIDDADPHFIDKSLDNGVVDAFIYDYPFAVASVKGTDLKFAVTKLEGSDIAYKIGVRSSDESLLTALNTAIMHVKNSDAYRSLLIKYFVSNQAVTTAASGSERTYSVQHGDTLGKIAAAQMGSSSAYRKIQARNNLANPDLIQVGQSLVIPAH